eukprot:CAMPEP_0178778312 /NCGR_PEP_ID=MMETSP0745-20121128/932_1 /TAXON_ID=913974 /ORGANISM="Nitzschia punctata, Strain CCMP561" /LENGTH=91 /DNA_ID=CAMNT_0020435443 /DNA_START=1146 /DNA_END=1417 /DNA_ORIENTATION=-
MDHYAGSLELSVVEGVPGTFAGKQTIGSVAGSVLVAVENEDFVDGAVPVVVDDDAGDDDVVVHADAGVVGDVDAAKANAGHQGLVRVLGPG